MFTKNKIVNGVISAATLAAVGYTAYLAVEHEEVRDFLKAYTKDLAVGGLIGGCLTATVVALSNRELDRNLDKRDYELVTVSILAGATAAAIAGCLDLVSQSNLITSNDVGG